MATTTTTTVLPVDSPWAVFQALLDQPPSQPTGAAAAAADAAAASPGDKVTVGQCEGQAKFHLRIDTASHPEWESLRVAMLCLDVSTSMSFYYNTLREAAQRARVEVQAAQLPMGVFFIIFFSNSVTRCVDAAAPDAEELIHTTPMGGGTNFAPPLEEIMSRRKKHNPTAHCDVFFATDGDASDGEAWQLAAKELHKSLTDQSHVCPVFFGNVPAETAQPAQPARRARANTSFQAESPYEKLQALELRAARRHMNRIDEFCQWIAESVQALRNECTGTIVVTGSDGTQTTVANVALFSNGETTVGVNVVDNIDALVGQSTVTMNVFAGNVMLATVPLSVVFAPKPITLQEQRAGFQMQVASRLGELRSIIELAVAGNQAALVQVLSLVEELRAARQALGVAESDPVAAQLQATHAQLQRVLKNAASGLDVAGAGFTVGGQVNALQKLQRTAGWQCTAEHGSRRQVRRAERATERVNELVVRHRERVAGMVKELQVGCVVSVGFDVLDLMCSVGFVLILYMFFLIINRGSFWLC